MSAVPLFSGQFLIAPRRTGLAPFGTHPALQKIRQSQAASSIRVEIGGSVSTRGYIAHVVLPARLVSVGRRLLRPTDRMMSPTRALRRFLRSQHQIRRVTNQSRLVNTLPALVQWR